MDAMSHSANVAFRKLGFAADELLDCVGKCRADAARAYQRGSAFDWKAAAERLQSVDNAFSRFLVPCKPALKLATAGKPALTVAEVDGKTACQVLERLAANTIKAFWFFWNMTAKGTKKLVIRRGQKNVFDEANLLPSLTALTRSEVRELRKQLESEIPDAEVFALRDHSLHPGEQARETHGVTPLYEPEKTDKRNKPKPSQVRKPILDEHGQPIVYSSLPEFWQQIGYDPKAKSSLSHDKHQKGKNSLPQNADVRDLCLHLKAKLAESPSIAACARDFCTTHSIEANECDGLLRQAKRFPHLWKT
jgi:hypothetical protein